jgi:hypothetical protein
VRACKDAGDEARVGGARIEDARVDRDPTDDAPIDGARDMAPEDDGAGSIVSGLPVLRLRGREQNRHEI